jgi:hypothetical protein
LFYFDFKSDSVTKDEILCSEGWLCQKFKEESILSRKLCYHGVDERIRLQEEKLWGIFSGPRGPKNQFLSVVANAAA